MGLLRKIFKRKLTPEQQEEQSRREKEWAEKCYKAGERFGERIGFGRHVNSLNTFANRYPRTFFGIIAAVVLGSLFINIMFTSVGAFLDTQTPDMPKIEHAQPMAPEVKEGINRLYDEYTTLAEGIEKYLDKETLTREDSVEIKRMLVRIKEIEQLMGTDTPQVKE